MALTTIGDILINAKPYLIQHRTYRLRESPTSYPSAGLGGRRRDSESRGDNWVYWSQSDWLGDGQADWLVEGPFHSGYGLDLTVPGQVQVANKLVVRQADAANTGGYVAFTVGTTRAWFLGKTNGTGYHSVNGTAWTAVANVLAVGVTPTSWGELKGTYYVGASDGKLYSTTGGTTFSAIAGPLGTPSYVLGSYKGRLYIGYANAVYTYTGSAFTQMWAGFVDGTPIIGTVGGGVLYFATQGPQSRVYMTDSNLLMHLVTMGNDFMPMAAVFLEAPYFFGGTTDEATTPGIVIRLQSNGMVPVYQHGDFGGSFQNTPIRSAILWNDMIVWSASPLLAADNPALGIFDPTMDVFGPDTQCGFYIRNNTDGVTGAEVDGILQWNNKLICGLRGSGIYSEDTPGTYKLVSTLFDGQTKNINKLWGRAEVKHSALISGQTVTIKTMKDAVTEDSWGTSNTVGATSALIAAPANYKSPYIQYVISGTANGSDLSLLDITFAYIETPDSPKKEWSMVLRLQGGAGSQNQVMRDKSLNTRTAMTMLGELNALWNTKTTYDDVDGTQYNVIFKAPSAGAEEFYKDLSGNVDDSLIFYAVHLVEL